MLAFSRLTTVSPAFVFAAHGSAFKTTRLSAFTTLTPSAQWNPCDGSGCQPRLTRQGSVPTGVQRQTPSSRVAPPNFVTAQRGYATRLAEVGKLEPLKLDGNYDTGQMFLHRLFGYRGVILFPWLAKVYDRDLPNSKKDNSVKDVQSQEEIISNPSGTGKEVKGKTHTYYQVLIDGRDCPFITHRAQTESVTFLGNHTENTRNLYAIPGLDYVAHEDIIPYSTEDRSPIQHELFDKFLSYREGDDPPFGALDTLKAWQEKNHPWLELSDVHKETTEDIRVTVIPFYMGYRETQANNVYWWRYCIRLENLGEKAVQLRERNWRIFSLSGTLETVRGRGVVGQEPLLSKDQPAFQYSSHVSLQAPSGHMWGTFRMEREDGHAFDCRIPPFSLESKQDDPNEPPILGN
ncbi:hypothetical protein TCAL_12747 [Tigriopus californicus]|uniref:ApaG domain-containing protein n=1 Tax=Tigriopus californicus TaxID=6832 RepID=A0A553NXL0_TIGCA|nr:polymerase delta-interacting protein 2-like [Tigriopus californicus]TRY70173.1 hypothetical protein TCAL_12747 [Tigriopus californicus]